MGPDIARRAEPLHLFQEGWITQDQILGHDACFDNLARAIGIRNKGVQGFGALDRARFDNVPFACIEHPWHHIKWDQPVRITAFDVNRKGDADPTKQLFGLSAAFQQGIWSITFQPICDHAILVPQRVVAVHFIIHSSHHPISSVQALVDKLKTVDGRTQAQISMNLRKPPQKRVPA